MPGVQRGGRGNLRNKRRRGSYGSDIYYSNNEGQVKEEYRNTPKLGKEKRECKTLEDLFPLTVLFVICYAV